MKAYLINIQYDSSNLFSWVALYCKHEELESLTGFTKNHLRVHTAQLDASSTVYDKVVSNPGTLYMTTDQQSWSETSLLYLKSLKLVYESERLVEKVQNRRVIEGEFVLSEQTPEPDLPAEVIYDLAKHLQEASSEVKPFLKAEYQERYGTSTFQKIEELSKTPWKL
ncbi:hypothetical protein VIBNIFTn2_120187 [Vibrio nigripulchritudo FTn2]|uniref:hypothetical protein n=1 Tax=Vibrio nigripulchritudo TaxID=28173 RepID=UPI0003B1EA3B|nr:hypothetical protein [Vibrio nigripulchritudo]CCN40205.1 hypothetical protein VIBNIFTn2_120187 [Vibrio nigripulchritudo FTn2]